MLDTAKTFQQIWDYRRKDDDVDSMSDDSKSGSGDEASGKMHMLVHVLSSPEKDEETDLTQLSQQDSQVNFTNGDHFKVARCNEKIQPGKKRKGADKKMKSNHREKRKRKVNQSTPDQDLAISNGFKTFTDSLVEELKVARKKMLVQMGKQIAKLATAKKPVLKTRKRKSCSVPKSDKTKHQPGNKSGGKTQTRNKGLTKGKSRSNRKRKVAIDNDQESRRVAVKKPQDIPTDTDHLASCLNSALPSDPHFCGISKTNANSNEKKEDSLADQNNHYNYLLGIQPAENLGSLDQITSSKGVAVYTQQHQNSQTTSRMVSVLPEPALHQWSNDEGFNHLRSQLTQENNTANMRMNDGSVMGFARRSQMF